MKHRIAIPVLFLTGALAALVLFSQTPGVAQAQGANPHNNGDCFACHSQPGMQGRFENGETISLETNLEAHGSSIHIQWGMSCVACHLEQRSYPHETSPGTMESCATCHWQTSGGSGPGEPIFALKYATARDFSLSASQTCSKCHAYQSDAMVDSQHVRVMNEGNALAPTCSDCHGKHDIQSPKQPRSSSSLLCSKCHLAVYTSYERSVHGAALAADGNPDVPTCGDCHGVHAVKGPDVTVFRADSIETCAKCHTNENTMAKYGISTDVMSTYLDDFHGRSVESAREAGAKDVPQATCYDCHGIHTIQRTKEHSSTVAPENLQATCGQCHPNASALFTQAWMGHSKPTFENNPALYLINSGYQTVTPLFIGGLAILIGLDARRRIAARKTNRAPEQEEPRHG